MLLIIMSGLSIELLRQNNLGMIQRRNLVKMADEKGDDTQIKNALTELQSHVSGHMNTSMGDRGIYLEHTYQRAYNRAVQRGLSDDSASRSLYEQADAACQATFNKTYSFPAYTQCVAERLSGQSANDPLQQVNLPSVDLYRYNFVSPIWSPDAAGLAVLITAILSLLLVGRITAYLVLWAILKLHK